MAGKSQILRKTSFSCPTFDEKFPFNDFIILGLCDWLHGTDSLFRRSISNKRNVTLTSLKSTRELFPDEAKKDK